MWSSDVLEYCAVVRLEDRFPRLVRIQGKEIFLDNTFFFTAFEEGRMYSYRNLGVNLLEIDKSNLAQTPEYDRFRMSVIGNSILRISADDYFIGILDSINKLPGCRVNPNIFSRSQDAYILIEFSENSQEEVSRILLKAIPAMPFRGELVYLGKEPDNMPFIVKLFIEMGGNINDLFLVTSEWHMKKENREKENSGVFMNEGKFVPKYFTSGIKNRLIFKEKKPGFKEKSEINSTDSGAHCTEYEIETNYFQDFYREVVNNYYGTLFYEAEVNGNVLTSHYVIEKKLSPVFFAGLEKHWSLPARKDHYNIVTAAMSLGAIYK